MMLAAILATGSMAAADGSWPLDYTCAVVTDETVSLEFALQTNGRSVRIDSAIYGFEAGRTYALLDLGKKPDGTYRQFRTSDEVRPASLYVRQTRASDRPITFITIESFDAGDPSKVQHEQAAGYCVPKSANDPETSSQ